MKVSNSVPKHIARTNHFVEAGPHDIVLGKGNGIKNHIGNREFRAIVKIYSWEYDQQPKAAKRVYAEDLGFIIIHGPDEPRRVLESFDGTVECCVEVQDPKVITEVVMHRLRNGRKARAKAAKKHPFTSDLSEDQLRKTLTYFMK